MDVVGDGETLGDLDEVMLMGAEIVWAVARIMACMMPEGMDTDPIHLFQSMCTISQTADL